MNVVGTVSLKMRRHQGVTGLERTWLQNLLSKCTRYTKHSSEGACWMLPSEVKGQHSKICRTPEPPGSGWGWMSLVGILIDCSFLVSQANHLTFRCRGASKLQHSQLTLTSDPGDLSRPFYWQFLDFQTSQVDLSRPTPEQPSLAFGSTVWKAPVWSRTRVIKHTGSIFFTLRMESKLVEEASLHPLVISWAVWIAWPTIWN